MDPDGNGDLSDSDPDYDIGLAMLEDATAVTEEIMTPRTPPVIVPPTLDRGKWISREGFQSYEICQAEGKDSIPTTLISGVGSDMKTLLKDAIVSVPKLNFLRFGNRSHAFTGDFDAPYSFGGRTVKFSPMPSPIRKLKEAVLCKNVDPFFTVSTLFSAMLLLHVMIIRVRTTGVTVIIREGTRNHGSRSIEMTKRGA
jgi:hypothetical protein